MKKILPVILAAALIIVFIDYREKTSLKALKTTISK